MACLTDLPVYCRPLTQRSYGQHRCRYGVEQCKVHDVVLCIDPSFVHAGTPVVLWRHARKSRVSMCLHACSARDACMPVCTHPHGHVHEPKPHANACGAQSHESRSFVHANTVLALPFTSMQYKKSVWACTLINAIITVYMHDRPMANGMDA